MGKSKSLECTEERRANTDRRPKHIDTGAAGRVHLVQGYERDLVSFYACTLYAGTCFKTFMLIMRFFFSASEEEKKRSTMDLSSTDFKIPISASMSLLGQMGSTSSTDMAKEENSKYCNR